MLKALDLLEYLLSIKDCLIKMMDVVYDIDGEDTSGSMILASDVIEHVLLTIDEVDWSCVGRLLKTLKCWIDFIGEASMDIRVADFHALIMDSVTTEDLIDD